VLSELTAPGEWYLDRPTGTLYLWPPGPLDSARIEFPLVEEPLISLQGASHVSLRDMIIESGRGIGVQIEGGYDNTVAGCTLRNLGTAAVYLHEGARNGALSCTISQIGGTAIDILAGDRARLVPAGDFAVNNHIHDFARTEWTYHGAVHLYGVGNRAANNLIYNAPHCAMRFGGNDNVIELNEIHDVCRETGDVGVIYTGRDWTVRGNVIRNNFIHHVFGPGMFGAQGVYLDDCASGSIVVGNVFYQVARAMEVGGGRDNVIENNLIVDCQRSLSFDNRGLTWMKDKVRPGGSMPKLLAAIPYRAPPWSQRYPQLLTLLNDDPGAPKGNVVSRNVLYRSGPLDMAQEVSRFGTVTENVTLGDPIGLVADPRLPFRLSDDSSVYRQLPGFQRIPFQSIGLYGDDDRK
jgi:hypothetical protein